MKKLNLPFIITGLFTCMLTIMNAHAAQMSCYTQPIECPNPDSSCNDICTTCQPRQPGEPPAGYTGRPGAAGIYTECINGTKNHRCGCGIGPSNLGTLKCDSGFYGTAGVQCNSSSCQYYGCDSCPSSATCAGGNGSTFVCDKDHYKTASACPSCPTLTFGNLGTHGKTSASGATSVTQCYIESGIDFNDGTGTFSFVSSCYYN